MARHGEASAALVLETRKYLEAMKEIPGVTEKEAKKAALAYQKHMMEMERQSARTSKKAAESAGDAVEQVTKVTDVVGKLPSVLNGAFGDVLGPIGDAGDLLGMIGPLGAAAAIGLGTFAAAGAAVVGSSIDMIMSLETNEAWLGRNTYGASEAREAFLSLGAEVDQLRADVAQGMAPALEYGADTLHGVVVVGRELLDMLPDLGVELGVVGDAMWQMAALTDTGRMLHMVAALHDAGEARRELDEANRRGTESDQVALQHQVDMAAQLGLVATAEETAAYHAEQRRKQIQEADKAAREAEAAAERAARERASAQEQLTRLAHAAAIERLDDEAKLYAAVDDQVAQIRKLAEVSGDWRTAEQAAIDAIASGLDRVYALRVKNREEQEKAAQAAAKEAIAALQPAVDLAFEDLGDDLARQLAEESASVVGPAIKASLAELDTTLKSSFFEVSDRVMATPEQMLAATQSLASSVFSLMDAGWQAQMANADTSTRVGQQAYLEAWENQKASAMAQAAVNTLLGISSAMSLPYPANIAAVAASGAALVAQEVAIANSPPPTFHAGTSTPLVDEQLAKLRAGEVVLSAPQVERLGGAAGVQRMVQSTPASSSPVVVAHLDFGDRAVTRLLGMQARRGTSNPWLGMGMA